MEYLEFRSQEVLLVAAVEAEVSEEAEDVPVVVERQEASK